MNASVDNIKLNKSLNISLDNDYLDDASYMMFYLCEKIDIKYRFKVGGDMEVDFSSIIKNKNLYNPKYGIPIGVINNAFGRFELFINGCSEIYNNKGILISSISVYEKYLSGEFDFSTLHFQSRSYITVINTEHLKNYYGIFYYLSDAIKVCDENDLVKFGEITS